MKKWIVGIAATLVLSASALTVGIIGITKGNSVKDGIDGKDGTNGTDGRSAYEIAVENGYAGTAEDWLLSLVGKDGKDGKDGSAVDKGDKGDKGDTGEKGDKGDKGDTGVGITNVTIDYAGHVTVELTDGTNYEVAITDPECSHRYEAVVVSPTCNTYGHTEYTCSLCGLRYKNDFVPASGHHFADGSCVFCKTKEPFGEIAVDTEWYKATPYVIETREQLAGLAYLVNNGNNFSGKEITLGNNIDLAYAEWIPIGTQSAPFAGTFNGKGLTVSGLKISRFDKANLGLFGYVTGTVKSFTVANANITVDSLEGNIAIACGYSQKWFSGITVSGFINAPKNSYVGGVTGSTGGNFSDCHSSADIVGASYVGGIAGYTNASGSFTISNLSNSGSVGGEDYVGGLVGNMNNQLSVSSNYTVTLRESENSGAVTGRNYVGGLYGDAYAYNNVSIHYHTTMNIFALNNTGAVTGKLYVGGLFGKLQSESGSVLQNSESGAHITGDAYLGGLAGKMVDVKLLNCDNTGTSIAANGYVTFIGDANNYAYVGGYAGYCYEAEGCSNGASIDYASLGRYVGGIAGYSAGNTKSCSNHAKINSTSSYVGGIVGYAGAAGNTTHSYLSNTAEVHGDSFVGGLAGYVYNCLESSKYCLAILRQETNSGKISGNNYVGGLFGYVYADNTDYHNSIAFTMKEFTNTGDVNGKNNVAGLVAYFKSEAASSLEIYSNTGTITSEGSSDELFVTKTNLTLKQASLPAE